MFFGNAAGRGVTSSATRRITAAVPSGTGTVHVTVQSGVVETDNVSGSPGANANAPIFGYGNSPATNADLFTFGNSSGTGNQPPTIGPIGTRTVTDGGTLSFVVSASSPGGSPLAFGLGAGAAAGAGIDARTGQFTWTPSQGNGLAPGNYAFSVTATDTLNPLLANTALFTVAVGPSSSNQGSGVGARMATSLGLTQSAEYYRNVITAAYATYLGRVPDAAGLSYWLGQMAGGLSDERLEAGFLGSAEYVRNHGGAGAGWVQSLYVTLLGRSPSSAEVQGWLAQLANGAATAAVAYGFAASAERESLRVAADYQLYLGRSARADEVQYWVSAFLSGGSNEKVVAGILASPEYFLAKGGDVVDWLYAAYRAALRREPDAAGYAYWLALLG